MVTFGGHSVSAEQSYHIRWTSGFGGLQLVNSVVAKSSLGHRAWLVEARVRQTQGVISLNVYWLYTDYRESWLRCLRLHLVLWAISLMTHRTADRVGVSDARASWATNAGWNLLASTVVSAQTGLTSYLLAWHVIKYSTTENSWVHCHSRKRVINYVSNQLINTFL